LLSIPYASVIDTLASGAFFWPQGIDTFALGIDTCCLSPVLTVLLHCSPFWFLITSNPFKHFPNDP
jgi:hypothetical protein